MNTPTPDYGEPWKFSQGEPCIESRDDDAVLTGIDYEIDDAKIQRAVSCVNACAGMTDPSEEIAKLRIETQMLRGMIKAMQQKRDEANAKLNAAEECLQKMIRSVPAQLNGFYFWPIISPDGDYLGEEPADPASVMYVMAEEAQKALSELQSSR
jgi:hypothetical protein